MFMTDSLRKLRKENPQMIKNWFPNNVHDTDSKEWDVYGIWENERNDWQTNPIRCGKFIRTLLLFVHQFRVQSCCSGERCQRMLDKSQGIWKYETTLPRNSQKWKSLTILHGVLTSFDRKNEISHLLCLFVNPFTFKCNNSIHSMYWSKEKLPWELLWVGSTAHWPPLDLDEWGVSSQEEGRVVDDTTTHWSFDCFWLVDDIEWSLCAWVLPMKNLE